MIPKFLRAPADIFASLEEIRARITDSTPPLVVVCAWCPGFVRGQQPASSTTGICQACSDKMIVAAVTRAGLLPDEVVELDPCDIDDRDEGSQCSTACGFCGRCS